MERVARARIKTRGAVTNPAGRFSACRVLPVDDGWGTIEEAEVGPDTIVMPELTRKIITRNSSPDVPFDRSINPYKGCEHGCVYCFARPSHAYMGLSPGLDFETRIFSKPDAAALLREELDKPGYEPDVIALGANTDPYQPVERHEQITRDVLKVLAEYKHPVAILTKSGSILRDLDILQEMAQNDLVHVYVSVTTLDSDLARRLEPRASSPGRRLSAVRVLNGAGVPAGVLVAPMIPGLNDTELEAILKAANEMGADEASYVLLRLPHELKDIFESWLGTNYPARAQRVLNLIRETRDGNLYQNEFGKRMRGTGVYADLLERRFQLAVKRLGLNQRSRKLDITKFERPIHSGEQMPLFAQA